MEKLKLNWNFLVMESLIGFWCSSLPDNFTTMRNQVRSCSFRVDQQPHPVATVQRSNTVSQVPIPAASPTMGFAQRFKFNPQPLQSDMSFVHDGLDSATDKATEQLSIRDEVISAIKLAEAGKKPPLPPTVPTSYVRNCNRIVLRVESLRTPPATAVERSPSSVGLPVLIHKRPVRNIKRVSSSTQTELSVLKRKVSTVPSQQSGHLIKRLIPLEKHWVRVIHYYWLEFNFRNLCISHLELLMLTVDLILEIIFKFVY